MPNLFADLATTAGSISAVDGVNVSEGMQRSLVNNAMRGIAAMVKTNFASSANTITASAGLFNLASISTGDYVLMAPPSGGSITSFGAASDGLQKYLESTGTTLLRNGASLSVQGGADLTIVAGDVVWVRRDQGVWKAKIGRADGSPVVAPDQGKHLVYVPASAMMPHSLSGAAGTTFETATNKHNFYGLLFDQSATEYAYFDIAWPKSANESTITWRFRGAAVSLSNSAVVIMKLQAVGVGNTDAEDAAFGTAQQCSISYSTANALGISPESPALTIANLAEGDLVQFRVWRDAQNTEDKLGADFRLRGLDLFITTNASNDA